MDSNTKIYSQNYSQPEEGPPKSSNDLILELVVQLEQAPKEYARLTKEIDERREAIQMLLKTARQMVPELEEELAILESTKKVIHREVKIPEWMIGRIPVDSLGKKATPNELPTPAPGMTPSGRKKRIYGKRKKIKSDIITDYVIDKIVELIHTDEKYYRATDIYEYLVAKKFIDPETIPGDPNRRKQQFGRMLERIDQDKLVYNNRYNIRAWGLPDFGTEAHERRKALLLKGAQGNRTSSYGRE